MKISNSKVNTKELSVKKDQTGSVLGKKSSESRPRFRRSKLSGRNLRRHPKGIKRSWILPTLGRWESGFEPQRIDDRGPRQVRLRACLKDLYGVRSTRISGKTIVRAAGKWNIQPGELEHRLDILLHRSGLANSRSQARQLVSHSHVYVENVLVTKPSHYVKVGQLVYIEPNFWIQQLNCVTHQWSKWREYSSATKVSTLVPLRVIPPYLEVDYLSGSRIFVNKPTGQTTLLPAGLGKRAQVALWG